MNDMTIAAQMAYQYFAVSCLYNAMAWEIVKGWVCVSPWAYL